MQPLENFLRVINPDRARVQRINRLIKGREKKSVEKKTNPFKPPFFRRK